MEPVANSWVTLHRVGSDTQGAIDSVRTDSRGAYSMRYRRTGSEDAVYFAAAIYSGIAYFTAPLPAEKAVGEDAEITVFDTTSGPVRLSVRGHHIVVSAASANALRSVIEVYDLSNDSSVTRVAADTDPAHAVWSAALPAGIRNAQVTQGDMPAASVSFTDGRVQLFAPLAPGTKQLSFSYDIPAGAFPLSVPSEFPTGVYEVMIEEKGGSVTGARLAEVAPVSVEQRNFRRFLASDVPKNSVTAIDLPAPAKPVDSRYLVALTLLIGGVMVAALARALRRA